MASSELEGKLVEIIGSIQTAASKASDFAIDQLPDIAQSYVAYGRVAGSVEVLLSMALLAVVAMLWKKISKSEDDTNIFMGAFMGGLFIGLPSVAWLCFAINNVLLVWLAPKVWLLKELAALVK